MKIGPIFDEWRCKKSALFLYPKMKLPTEVILYVLLNRLLIGLARDRLKQMVEKLYLVVSLAVSSLEDKASRRSYAGCLFQANLLMAPIVFATGQFFSELVLWNAFRFFRTIYDWEKVTEMQLCITQINCSYIISNFIRNIVKNPWKIIFFNLYN